jgi:hypothetical protein
MSNLNWLGSISKFWGRVFSAGYVSPGFPWHGYYA